MPPLRQFKRFDVRDLISRCIQPFPEIRQRVEALKLNEELLFVAPVLPSPLIEKLRREGFAFGFYIALTSCTGPRKS
jgi:hypothetical protein